MLVTNGGYFYLTIITKVEPRKSATARTDGGAEPLHLAATKGGGVLRPLLRDLEKKGLCLKKLPSVLGFMGLKFQMMFL